MSEAQRTASLGERGPEGDGEGCGPRSGLRRGSRELRPLTHSEVSHSVLPGFGSVISLGSVKRSERGPGFIQEPAESPRWDRRVRRERGRSEWRRRAAGLNLPPPATEARQLRAAVREGVGEALGDGPRPAAATDRRRGVRGRRLRERGPRGRTSARP